MEVVQGFVFVSEFAYFALCPAGYLPHKGGGDRQGASTLLNQSR